MTVRFYGLVIAVFLIFSFLIFDHVILLAQEDTTSGETVTEKKEPTRQEDLERISRILRTRKAVREAIKEIEIVGEAATGKIEYNGTRIESLDDESLKSLLDTVINTSRAQQMKNMERLQKQLKQVENLQRINRSLNTAPARPPAAMPNIPKIRMPRVAPVVTPKAPPRVPQTR